MNITDGCVGTFAEALVVLSIGNTDGLQFWPDFSTCACGSAKYR